MTNPAASSFCHSSSFYFLHFFFTYERPLVGILPSRSRSCDNLDAGFAFLQGCAALARAAQIVLLPVPHEAQAGGMRLTSLKLPFCSTSRHPTPCGHMTVSPRSSKCASPTATADNEAVQGFAPPPQAALNAIQACSQCTCPTLRRAAPHHDPPGLFLFSGLFFASKATAGCRRMRSSAYARLCKTFLQVPHGKGDTHVFPGIFQPKKSLKI